MIKKVYTYQLLSTIRDCVNFFSENGPTEEGDYTQYYDSMWSELGSRLEACFEESDEHI